MDNHYQHLLINSVTKQQWYPVATTEELTDNFKSVRLMEQDILLWRRSKQIQAIIDRCPHRGAKLSQGWLEQDYLVCPYHGLAYDLSNGCVKIPAHPELTPPQGLHLQFLPTQENYGLIWVALQEPDQSLPLFQQWHDRHYRKLLCGPYFYKASAYRAIENFLDVAHLPFVHAGLLGEPQYPQIEPYSVSITNKGLETSTIELFQPNPDGTGQTTKVTYQYQVHCPLIASFVKITPAGEFAMFIALTPLSAIQSRGWMGIAMNYGHEIPDETLIAFQDRIVAQDIPIVESQTPQLPSLTWLDEIPLPLDKLAVAYRKWLKHLGVTFGVR